MRIFLYDTTVSGYDSIVQSFVIFSMPIPMASSSSFDASFCAVNDVIVACFCYQNERCH
jgi:hypothetical protein